MLTVYSNRKTCIAVLCNTTAMPYLKEYQKLISSLDINPANDTEATGTQSNNPTQSGAPVTAGVTKGSVVGLWTDYMLETNGYNINNMPQYTAGYLRKEYAFNADGTYTFRNKQWIVKTKDILFIYESGTYKVEGNRLTITPKTGKSGFWAKMARTTEWGKLVKMSDYKLEKTSYTFDIEDFSGSDSRRLNLQSDKSTQRDGGRFNRPDDPFIFHYSWRNSASIIDNPPGFKP